MKHLKKEFNFRIKKNTVAKLNAKPRFKVSSNIVNDTEDTSATTSVITVTHYA
jgi:hypothetical protein